MKTILFILGLCASISLKANEIDTWSSPPTTLSSLGVNSTDVHVDMDQNGNSVAVWVENGFIKSKTKLVSGSWSSATTLSLTGASSPQVVVDFAGNAAAIWVESGAIKAATKNFGAAWSASTTLALSSSSSPRIAVNRTTGDLTAVWLTSSVVIASSKPFGGIWSVVPQTLSSGSSMSPQVAIGDNGTIVAVWATLNAITSLYNVNAANKTILGLWSTTVLVSNPAVNSNYPHLTVDPNGNTMAVWFSYNVSGTSYSNVYLQSSSFPLSGSWSTPSQVSDTPGVVNPALLYKRVACDAQTNAIALWTISEDGSTYNLESSSSTDRATWSPPQVLLSSIDSYSVDVDTNAIGDGFALGMQYDAPTSSIIIEALESHIGGFQQGIWGNSVGVSNGTSNAYGRIATTISGSNAYAVAAWTGYNGSNTIIQSVFGTGTLVVPPSGLSAVQNSNNWGVFTEYYNTVSWSPSSDANLVGYVVYRNGVMIDLVDSGTLSIIDHNRVQLQATVYGVSALDSSGTESAVITVNYP